MKRLIFILISIAGLFCLASCSGEEPQPQGNGISFTVPASVVLEADAQTLSFEVVGGKAPGLNDIIILDGPQGQKFCRILSSDSASFTIELYEGISAGEYRVSVQHGIDVTYMGTMKVEIRTVSDGVEPEEGSTVYGKVSCGGEGLAGIVVSDGYEVAVTDENGVYQLASEKKHGYVFISVPSGYMVPREGVLPQFYKYISGRTSVQERADFELVKTGLQNDFTMLIFGDMHLANRTSDLKQFADFITDVNSYAASHQNESIYGLTLGDMTWDTYWVSKSFSFPEYLAEINKLNGLPIWQVAGNHDHSLLYAGDFDTMKDFKLNLGPSYYSFNIGKVHFIVLDDIECRNLGDGESDYTSNIVQEQLDWLAKDLSYVSKDTPLLIAMHAPMYSNPGTSNTKKYNLSTTNASKLEAMIEAYSEVHIFTGHTHKMYNLTNTSSDSIYEHNAGAVCASWWWTGHLTSGIHLAQDGAPGGYSIVKVSGDDFSWQFKATGAPVEHQFRTYDRNCIELSTAKYLPKATNETYIAEFEKYASAWMSASTANEVYINVWNYDKDWKVEVTENGNPLTVSRVSGYDPLHLISYPAKRYNSNNSASFQTAKTYHLFKVKASSASSTLEIKVTDRFGNVYTESMARPKAFEEKNYLL